MSTKIISIQTQTPQPQPFTSSTTSSTSPDPLNFPYSPFSDSSFTISQNFNHRKNLKNLQSCKNLKSCKNCENLEEDFDRQNNLKGFGNWKSFANFGVISNQKAGLKVRSRERAHTYSVGMGHLKDGGEMDDTVMDERDYGDIGEKNEGKSGFCEGKARVRQHRSVTFSPVLEEVEFIFDNDEINSTRRGSWGVAPFEDEYWDGKERKFKDVPDDLEDDLGLLEGGNSSSTFETLCSANSWLLNLQTFTIDIPLEGIVNNLRKTWTEIRTMFRNFGLDYESFQAFWHSFSGAEDEDCLNKMVAIFERKKKNNVSVPLPREVTSAFSTAVKN